MNTPAFEDLLDRHGADLSRWPSELRNGAAALLAASAEARDLHAAMATVEEAIRATSLGPAPADSARTAVSSHWAAVAMRCPQARRVSPVLRNAKFGAAIAAALVLGMLVGTMRFEPTEISPDQVVTSALESAGSVDVD